METLLAVDQHRNQYYYNGRGKINGNGGGGRFVSSPTRGFREINCRTFESGAGLLPNPFMGFGSPGSNTGLLTSKDQTQGGGCSGKVKSDEGKNLKKIVSDVLLTPKGQDLGGSSNGKMKIDEGKMLKKYVKSSPISINSNVNGKKERIVREDLSFSELWAGPAYSNSPPPSSLPIPKFSLKPKRTVSLELPELESDLSLQPMAKSAPASPTREFAGLPRGFGGDDDFATKTLRRILNLDIADD